MFNVFFQIVPRKQLKRVLSYCFKHNNKNVITLNVKISKAKFEGKYSLPDFTQKKIKNFFILLFKRNKNNKNNYFLNIKINKVKCEDKCSFTNFTKK